MNPWFGFILSVVGIIIIPTEILMIRMAVRWTKVETTLVDLAEGVKKLAVDKEKEHQQIRESAMYDRTATDRRLRWLEENLWHRGRGRGDGNAV